LPTGEKAGRGSEAVETEKGDLDLGQQQQQRLALKNRPTTAPPMADGKSSREPPRRKREEEKEQGSHLSIPRSPEARRRKEMVRRKPRCRCQENHCSVRTP